MKSVISKRSILRGIVLLKGISSRSILSILLLTLLSGLLFPALQASGEDNSREVLVKGLAAYGERNFKLASSCFERYTPFSDLLKDYIFFWWASSLKEIGEEEKAIRLYDKIGPQAPIRKKAVEELNFLHKKRGDWSSAFKSAQERLALEKNKRWRPLWEKEVLEGGYLLKKASLAIDNFKRLMEDFPGTPEALEVLSQYGDFYSFKGDEIPRARVYLRHGQFKMALDVLKDREDSDSLAIKAEAFSGLRDYKEAASILERLVKERKEARFSLRLGEIYLAGSGEEKGAALLEKLAQEKEGSHIACLSLWDLVNYWKRKDDIEKTKIYCQRLREGYRSFSLADKAIWMEGWMSLARKDYPEADRIWQSFDTISRPSREKMSSLYLRSWLRSSSNPKEADRMLVDLVSLYPDTYYGLKALEKISSIYSIPTELPFKLGPLAEEAELERARVLLELRRQEEAIFELEDLKRKRYNDWNLRYNLSRLYGECGKFYEAINEAESLVDFFKEKELWPGFMRIREKELLEINFPRFYREDIKKRAREFNLDENLIYAIMREESRFKERDVSSSGAVGLMQLLPSTASWIMEKNKLREIDREGLFRPDINIFLGSWYLRYLLDKFNGDILLTIAAYNGGPGLIERWVKDGGLADRDMAIERLPKEETRFYCQKVLFSYYLYKKIYGDGGEN